jgi:hypothetical protein
MRRVVLQMGRSLDGYVASDRDHPGTAVPEDTELIRWKTSRVAKAGAHLMGRVTDRHYSYVFGHRSSILRDPGRSRAWAARLAW